MQISNVDSVVETFASFNFMGHAIYDGHFKVGIGDGKNVKYVSEKIATLFLG